MVLLKVVELLFVHRMKESKVCSHWPKANVKANVTMVTISNVPLKCWHLLLRLDESDVANAFALVRRERILTAHEITFVIFYLLPELVSWICDVDHIASNSENLFSKWRINEMKLVLFVKLSSLLEGVGSGVTLPKHCLNISLQWKLKLHRPIHTRRTGRRLLLDVVLHTKGRKLWIFRLVGVSEPLGRYIGTVTLENAGSSQIREAMTNVSLTLLTSRIKDWNTGLPWQ